MKVIGLDALLATLTAMQDNIIPVQARALQDGGQVIAEAVKGEIMQQGLYDSGDLHNSTKSEAVNQTRVEVSAGDGLPYAFVHEYGLKDQVITRRQHGFFWAKHAETGDDMWKALALSATYTIPARPFFRPGYDKSKRDAVKAIAQETANILNM